MLPSGIVATRASIAVPGAVGAGPEVAGAVVCTVALLLAGGVVALGMVSAVYVTDAAVAIHPLLAASLAFLVVPRVGVPVVRPADVPLLSVKATL